MEQRQQLDSRPGGSEEEVIQFIWLKLVYGEFVNICQIVSMSKYKFMIFQKAVCLWSLSVEQKRPE